MLKVRRLGYALGAEITGVDAAQPIAPEAFAAIRRALLDHIVLCFPGQDLDAAGLKAFAERFGELDVENSGTLNSDPSDRGVVLLTSQPVNAEGRRVGGNAPARWHSDRSYKERPSLFTFLVAKVMPEAGGDTMFANTYAAYDALSPAFREMIDPIRAIQDIALWPSYRGKGGEAVRKVIEANPPVVQRIVQTHPETGRKAIYLGEDKVRHFVGMSEEETKPLVDFLNRHATRPEFVYRHSWNAGDLVLWDNRCALHYPVPDYDPEQLRLLLRCSVVGPRIGEVWPGPSALQAAGA